MTAPSPPRKYCEADDLMLGQLSSDIPRWVGSNYDKHIELGAEEIDMMVGRVYALPLNLVPGSAEQLLMKKLNRFITTGRILMAASSAQETGNVHRYAQYLLAQANAALDAIVKGELVLNGQTPAAGTIQDFDSGPSIFLSDQDSFIRKFYGHGEAEFTIPPSMTALPEPGAN
ncbi:hypothetical protein SEA_JUMBO_14 [Gordonia phage Jumbo]|uniref:Head-to-tail adaptor n=1 Tax=Gordonia phage Jumbo TaxID=1887650 RepID=A0A1B3B0I0_9CAUD|nr:hypothetical protein BIZ69_gp014 [Gordonia phage Jumbo]AOE44527.1 hypothetical protein SEA_JUMBO_14 [Gordonia phage Jumbo]